MKISVDLKNCWLYGKGIAGFTYNLLKDFSEVVPDHFNVKLLSPDYDSTLLKSFLAFNKFETLTTKRINRTSKLSKIYYDQFEFLRYLNRTEPDLFLTPYFDVPFLQRTKFICTVHDLAILDLKHQYGVAFSLYYEILLKKCIREASCILTVSEHSGKSIIERFNVPAGRVQVFYNKVHASFLQPSTGCALPEIPNEFILYTGGLDKRKNIPVLIEGYLRAKKTNSNIPPLVITGISKELKEAEWKSILTREHIIIPGYLSNDQLVELYRRADLLVNTSAYEGFGMPILEALTLGKDMLCSDIAVYREIGKDFVHYFDSSSEDSFYEMLCLYFSGKLASIDKVSMKNRAAYFNEMHYGKKLLNLIESV